MSDLVTPSPELLRKLLRHEPDTGRLFWLHRSPDMFKDGKHTRFRTCNRWNARLAGCRAFYTENSEGYLVGKIFGRMTYAHQIIWAIVHGKLTGDEIDHINGVPSDNRISNLRSVSHLENGRNQKTPRNNTSGVIGVSWDKAGEKWLAQIGIKGRKKYLGLFTEKSHAIAARKSAETQYGFHENHGRES